MFTTIGRTLACLLVASLALASFRTHAQAYPCNGPGPGEVMVGMAPGGNGVASQPMCAQVNDGSQGGYQQQQAPAPRPNVYMTVVGHTDTDRLWVARGFSSQDLVEKFALDACNQVMGANCGVGASWSNDATIVVVQDVAGNYTVKGGASGWSASSDAMGECKKYSSGCHEVGRYKNSFNGEEVDFPKGPIERRRFGAVARTKDKAPDKWDDIAWLVTGVPGFRAAEAAAIEKCHNDTGMECTARVSAGEGYIVRMVNQKGQVVWWEAPSLEMIDKVVPFKCAKGETCRVVDTFDVRPAGSTTFEVSVSKAPMRGFMSLARPVDDQAEKAWNRRALVTSQPSVAAAQAAAIALCEKESGAKCAVTPKDGDNGIDQFVLLLRTPTGEPKGFWGTGIENVKSQRDTWCAQQKVQCPDGVTYDLAKKNVSTTVKF